MITEQTTLNKLFEIAKESTNDVASGEVYILKVIC